MNGEKAHADSKGIRRRSGHLLPDHHPVAERTAEAGRGKDATRRNASSDWQNQGMADPGITDSKSSEAGPQAKARMEERPETQYGSGDADRIDPRTLPFRDAVASALETFTPPEPGRPKKDDAIPAKKAVRKGGDQ